MKKVNHSKNIRLAGSQKPFLERNELLMKYYDEIRDYEVLSYEETIRLFEIYQTGSTEEKACAKRKIFNHNARLVVSLARQYCTNFDNIMDLIQEGNMGLLNAIDRFRIDKNSSFTKFALFYIRREVNLFKMNGTNLVRQTNRSKTRGTVSDIVSELMQEEDRMPTNEEIFERFNEKFSSSKIKNKSDISNIEYVFLSSMEANDGEFSDSQNFIDYTNATSSVNDCIASLAKSDNMEILNIFLKDLTPQEKEAIEYFYGINGQVALPWNIIGEKLNVSVAKVKQLCNSARYKMKKKAKALSYSC